MEWSPLMPITAFSVTANLLYEILHDIQLPLPVKAQRIKSKNLVNKLTKPFLKTVWTTYRIVTSLKGTILSNHAEGEPRKC